MSGGIICGIDDSESAKVVEPDTPEARVSGMAERREQLSAGASEVDCGAAWFVEAGRPVDGLVAAAKRAQASLIVVGSTGNGRGDGDGSDGRAKESAGGIARFGLGGGGTDFAGGIARFGLGSDDKRGG